VIGQRRTLGPLILTLWRPFTPYDGLFQFSPSTFRAHGGTDIWDPTQQAQIAASTFASGESGGWPVCSRR
jgi:hypothetical protein